MVRRSNLRRRDRSRDPRSKYWDSPNLFGSPASASLSNKDRDLFKVEGDLSKVEKGRAVQSRRSLQGRERPLQGRGRPHQEDKRRTKELGSPFRGGKSDKDRRKEKRRDEKGSSIHFGVRCSTYIRNVPPPASPHPGSLSRRDSRGEARVAGLRRYGGRDFTRRWSWTSD